MEYWEEDNRDYNNGGSGGNSGGNNSGWDGGSQRTGEYRYSREPEVPGVKDYLLWMLIPGLLSAVTCGIGGLVLSLVWAFSSGNTARSNYFKAVLLVSLIGVAIGVIFMIISAAVGFSMFTSSRISNVL